MLLAAPNVSEGRDRDRIASVEEGFAAGATLLDTHSDAAHNRSVLTLAAEPGDLAPALLRGARAAVGLIDMRVHRGAHPCVGALDVCPVVWPEPGEREAARREAERVAELIADELEVPVFLYGDLAAPTPERERTERAFFRRGGLAELTSRMEAGELHPDRGPERPHSTAGATLVTARAPLAAFNVELDARDLTVAEDVAAALREAGGGPSGVRAIGIQLDGSTQVSVNVHDPASVPLARVLAEVARLARQLGARPVAAEVVGLVPEAALEGWTGEVPLVGFDPEQHVIERRVRRAGS